MLVADAHLVSATPTVARGVCITLAPKCAPDVSEGVRSSAQRSLQGICDFALFLAAKTAVSRPKAKGLSAHDSRWDLRCLPVPLAPSLLGGFNSQDISNHRL